MKTLPLLPLRLVLYSILSISMLTAQVQVQETPWELGHNEDGLLIYTRPAEGGQMLELKAVATVLGNIDTAYALISNPKKFAATDPYSSNIRILKNNLPTNDPNDVYYYQTLSTPFFAQDRDMVVRIRRRATSNGYFITLNAVTDVLPPADGYVRDNSMQTYISLQHVSPTSFEITYKISIRMADLPAGVMNKTIFTSAHDRMSNLCKFVASKQ